MNGVEHYLRTEPFDASINRGMIRLFDLSCIEIIPTPRRRQRFWKRKRIQPELYPLFDIEDDALFD